MMNNNLFKINTVKTKNYKKYLDNYDVNFRNSKLSKSDIRSILAREAIEDNIMMDTVTDKKLYKFK